MGGNTWLLVLREDSRFGYMGKGKLQKKRHGNTYLVYTVVCIYSANWKTIRYLRPLSRTFQIHIIQSKSSISKQHSLNSNTVSRFFVGEMCTRRLWSDLAFAPRLLVVLSKCSSRRGRMCKQVYMRWKKRRSGHFVQTRRLKRYLKHIIKRLRRFSQIAKPSKMRITFWRDVGNAHK